MTKLTAKERALEHSRLSTCYWALRALSQEWAVKVQSLENLISNIQSALNTEETGEALVEVARNAHRAEMELASEYSSLEE